MAMPSITLCGSPSSTLRSMYAPGSPSSALHSTYFRSPGARRVNSHFMNVGKPAPPRPRKPEPFISSTTCSGWSPPSTFASAA